MRHAEGGFQIKSEGRRYEFHGVEDRKWRLFLFIWQLCWLTGNGMVLDGFLDSQIV
jgi:hypothetical protein